MTTRATRQSLGAIVALGLALATLYTAVSAAPGAQPGFPDISDTWFIGGFRDQPIEVQQSGPAGQTLAFWNTRRQAFEGRFENPFTIIMTSAPGEVTGTLAGDNRINWSDGSFWTRPGSGSAGRIWAPGAPAVAARGPGLRFNPSNFQYRVGQLVQVCFTLPGEGRVVLTDVLPDRSAWDLVNDIRGPGESCVSWVPGPDDGRECIRLVFRVTQLEEKCFQVVRR